MKYILLLLVLLLHTETAHAYIRYAYAQTQSVRIGRTIRSSLRSPRRRVFRETASVVNVVDGSVFTIKRGSGPVEVVRLLGAEAPLLVTGSKKAQCFANASRQKLEALIKGKEVYLLRDERYQRDNKRRLLRYVSLQTLDVNGWMIDRGYAFADTENSHTKSAEYASRQQESKRYERGLWGHRCEYNPNLDTIEIIDEN